MAGHIVSDPFACGYILILISRCIIKLKVNLEFNGSVFEFRVCLTRFSLMLGVTASRIGQEKCVSSLV